MKRKRILFSLGAFLLLGTTFGIAFQTAKTIYQNQISLSENSPNQSYLQNQEYKSQNKADNLRVKDLTNGTNHLQFLVQELQELNLSNKNLNDIEINEQNISKNGYKAFEEQVLALKRNLVKKATAFNQTLKTLLDKNDQNLSQETQQGITNSLNKGKTIVDSLNKTKFNDNESMIKALKAIKKAQNTYLNQFSNIITLLFNQINQYSQEINDLKKQISQRDNKIKEFAQKLIKNLRFNIRLITQFKKTLNSYDDFHLEEIDQVENKKIKNKVKTVLKLLNSKEDTFSDYLDAMIDSLDKAQEVNDYSNVKSYDLYSVNKGFERIVKEYELVRVSIISLLTKKDQEKSTQILNQAQHIKELEFESQNLQTRINDLNNQKTALEESFAKNNQNLISTLVLILDNQISALTQIKTTIQDSQIENATNLANSLQEQIDILLELKNKHNPDDYTQTYTQSVNQALNSAQKVIDQYKQSVLNSFKEEYQITLNDLKTTQEQLQRTQVELTSKNQELLSTQNLLVQTENELSQTRTTLEKTQESLQTVQTKISDLNTQVLNSKEKAKSTYDFAKEIYNNIKSKATTFVAQADSNTDTSQLNTQLSQALPEFDENSTLDQMQASVKALIDMSTQLSNVFNNAYQDSFNKKSEQLNTTLNSLNNGNKVLQIDINNLNQKLNTFLNTLISIKDSVFREYQSQIFRAQRIRNQARQWQINTSNLEGLLALQDLASSNKLDQQIQIIKEYTDRINNLSSEISKIQGKIIDKTKEQLSKMIEKRDEYKNKYDNEKLINEDNLNTILSLNQNIKTLKDQFNNIKVEKNQKEEQNKKLANQLDNSKLKLKEMTSKYLEFKNLILNSNVYKIVEKIESNTYHVENPATGYTTSDDWKKYGKYFKSLKRFLTPDTFNVINQIKVFKSLKNSFDTFKVKIAYIDPKISDSIQYKNVTIKPNETTNGNAQVIELSNWESENGAQLREIIVVKNIGDNKYEFTNIVATIESWGVNDAYYDYNPDNYDPETRHPIIRSKTPKLMISVQVLDE
ncbi:MULTISPECIES: hypothetical protein [unclassified Mycoplasma]|uniref:hypothetical protein n=1 Tax=unclassified Mycoplasma TaxID=2683645 RepID=UPI00211B9C6F|nr:MULTISPECIES: hypothetical protein [unclassified Mycoplasma]UUM19742.1 hypothetical protein NPA11_03160 [Mycoplasma sp. 1578d]UUM24725.1 hypothetical protein NPA12_03450 [Mycoplasma sp. 3686d]